MHKNLHFSITASPWKNRLQSHLNQHWQAALWSVRKLTRMPLTSFVALIIIGITLTLPTILNTLLQTAQSITQQWYSQETLSLYLRPELSDERIQALRQALSAHPNVTNIRYISPKEGLKEFKQLNAAASAVLDTLEKNPLPAVLIIQPKPSLSVNELEHFHQQLARLPDVDIVQFDSAWAKRLHAFIFFSREVLFLLIGLLSLGVSLIISNTIHLSIQGHEMEMDVLELMGATTAYIRRPFLYTGLLMGLIGGFAAWIITTIVLSRLEQSIQALAASYGGQLTLYPMSGITIVSLISGSAFLGVIGAVIGIRSQRKSNYGMG